MPQSTFEKFLPASGVLAGVLFLVGGFVEQLPGSDLSDAAALAMVEDHQLANTISTIATALCALVLVFFATGLRAALRSGEGGESSYSSVAYGGTVLLAGVLGVDAWVTLALIDGAMHGDGSSTGAVTTLLAANWLPLLAAAGPMLFAAGFGGLRTAALPKWLAIVSIVLGVCCLGGPTGFAVFFALPFWLAAVGVVLTVRQRAATPAVRVEEAAV